ncbi:MAG: DUF58 domain-containing protein [Pseudomonadota bacterium]
MRETRVRRLLTGWREGRALLHASPAVSRPLLSPAEIAQLAQRAAVLERVAAESAPEVAHRRLGESRSLFRGSGMDYDESRPFQTGDDPRHIDWRLSARSGDSYVKRFREERRPTIFIVVDRRAAMRFGTRRRLKVTQAARIATLVAFAARRRQRALAGVLLEPSVNWLGESSGRGAAQHFAEAAARPAPPCDSAGEPALKQLLSQLSRLLVRGSQIWLISDLHDLTPDCRGPLFALAGEHQLRCVQLFDPAERQLPQAGPLRLFAGLDDEEVVVDSNDRRSRRAFEAGAAAQQAERMTTLEALQIPCRQISTECDEPEQELGR